MAFSSIKNIFSINKLFQKPPNTDIPSDHMANRCSTSVDGDEPHLINFEAQGEGSNPMCLNLWEPIKSYGGKKGSLSDTNLVKSPQCKNKKKLKIDIKKSRSINQLNSEDNLNIENTPKHVLMESKESDEFGSKFREVELKKTLNLIDAMLDCEPYSPPERAICETKSLSDLSDESLSDLSIISNKFPFKMCHKSIEVDNQRINSGQVSRSSSQESFTQFDLQRRKSLVDYQMTIGKLDENLRHILNEFNVYLEMAKAFRLKSSEAPLSSTMITCPSKAFVITPVDLTLDIEPCDMLSSFNFIMEKTSQEITESVMQKLVCMKTYIEEFINVNFANPSMTSSLAVAIKKCQRLKHKRTNVTQKKKIKYFDFPDLRDVMINLFTLEEENYTENIPNLICLDESDSSNCMFKSTSLIELDASTSQSNDREMSINSSIGHFSLLSSEMTVYSESLDRIVSYNSFQDDSLYSTCVQKPSIQRLTFYIQVHGINLSVSEEDEVDSILFHCPSCEDTQSEENGLIKHLVSAIHCEKIHFLYKTAYIRKCVATGKEIQPSTVLNPMRMYRDYNKIVCFGDGQYACTLCFECLIVGESVLMAHCNRPHHVDMRHKVAEIID